MNPVEGLLDDPNISRTDKIILRFTFYSIPACVIVYFLYCAILGPTAEQQMRQDNLQETFSGVVDTVFNDRPNHNFRVAILSNGYKFYMIDRWESIIEKSDSLSKKKGSYLIEVFKKNGSKLELDYRSTYTAADK